MAIEQSLSALTIAAAIGIPLVAIGMIVVSWLNDSRSDAILRKLDDN